jgi:hypothetical protein
LNVCELEQDLGEKSIIPSGLLELSADGAPPELFSADNLRLALARQAYESGRFRIGHNDLRGFDCLVATRQGLFACNRSKTQLIACGLFFGMAIHRGFLYLFEACDRPRHPTRLGRIARLRLRDYRLSDPAILVTGLDNGCHQIAIIEDALCVLDTYSQNILRFALRGEALDARAPFPIAPTDDTSGAYVHMNSIHPIAGRIGILLHNGAAQPRKPSELALLDMDWRVLERRALPGYGCHDILRRADGALLHCGSLDGELICPGARRIKVSDGMTRGLAMNGASIMIGAMPLLERASRDAAMGSVVYLDHAFHKQAEINIPGMPTVILALE